MNRAVYLEKKEYKELHNYLSLLTRIESSVTHYLNVRGLQNLLVKKTLVFGKNQPIFSYKISYDFFEETEEIGYKETQISFTVILTFYHNDLNFDISADITSLYEMASLGWYKKINKLPVDAKSYFENSPVKFVEIMDNFFDKELG